MLNRYLIYASGALQFVVLCMLMSLCILISSFFINLLNEHFLGMSIQEILALKSIPLETGDALQWINIVGLVIALLIPALLFAYLAHPQPNIYLGASKPARKYHWFWGISLILLALPFSNFIQEWSAGLSYFKDEANKPDAYANYMEAILSGKGFGALASNVLAVCILPAVIEEFAFRGCIQQVLIKFLKGPSVIAIFITAILFSVFHDQASGFLPRLFLGLILGLAYYFSGSIWVSVVMHAINNFVIVFLIWLFKNQYTTFDIYKMSDTPMLFAALSLVLCGIMLFYFYKYRVDYDMHRQIEVEPLEENN
jgi:membrane protease YdiL (CAAX protease family)